MFLFKESGEKHMKFEHIGAGLIATIAATFIATSVHAAKPESFRYMTEFSFPVVDCGSFQVWTSGWERDTEKWWYDKDGNPEKLQVTINITESQYFNNVEPDKFVTQGKNGVGENVTVTIDLVTGDQQNSGALFRLTIPGIGHVLLDVGTLFWDQSTQTVIRHGPDFALAEGETGLALCEAVE